MRRATRVRCPCGRVPFISIHALREESDVGDAVVVAGSAISIHALREESDLLGVAAVVVLVRFQSTLSVRRATSGHTSSPLIPKFQSTLSVRRATARKYVDNFQEIFQSTLSVRRATVSCWPVWLALFISIHALREESDQNPCRTPRADSISIHALREESDCTDGQHVSHCGTSILRTSSRVAGFEVKTRYSNHSTKK